MTKVTNKSWLEVFDDLVPISRKLQCMPNSKIAYEKYLRNNNFEYRGISNKKGTRKPTVESFADTHRVGIYLVRVASHVVAIVDGIYYDTWDSGHKSIYGYWEKS